MDKGDYISQLFDDIKDEIEFDSDVSALESLLYLLLDENLNDSITKWKYLILKYDLDEMMRDVDFTPLIKIYPNALLKKVGIEAFFDYISDLPLKKAKIIYNHIFNIYEPDCFIYQSLNFLLEKNDYLEEKNLIRIFLDKSSDFFEGIFDKTEFIRRVILIHIDHHELSNSFLQDLIYSLDSKKDQAVLKTLLINYLTF